MDEKKDEHEEAKLDEGVDEKEKKKLSAAERRSRSRSVSQRLAAPVEAFTTALRDRARSRSRSKSLLPPPRKPSEEDEKNLPALPISDEKPPRLSLDNEKAPRLSLSEKEADDEKPALVTVTGPARPFKDYEKTTRLSLRLSKRLSEEKRANSIDSLDTPTSPDSPIGDEKKVVERRSVANSEETRDSKLADEGLDEEPKKTEEQERKRKMRESRQQLKMQQTPDEQERLDLFQCM